MLRLLKLFQYNISMIMSVKNQGKEKNYINYYDLIYNYHLTQFHESTFENK